MKYKRIIASTLICGILAGNTSSAFAAEASCRKEEVVYAILNDDGGVNGVYVVNSFTGSENIVDYGNYTEIRNLTTTDSIQTE